MKPNERQKMCGHCDGRIPIEAETCPYCSSNQADEKVKNSFQGSLFQQQSLQDSLTSLYSPPYGGKKSTFEDVSPSTSNTSFSEIKIPEQVQANLSEKAESSLWPTILMIVGSNFLTLSLLQLFFSNEGVVRLEWDGSYWFIYGIIALPLLIFGYKKMQSLN